MCFIHFHIINEEKLDPRALKCVFISFSVTQADKCYHPPIKQYFKSVDVTFNEAEAYFTASFMRGRN